MDLSGRIVQVLAVSGEMKILIADDHPFTRLHMRRVLNRRSGWHVCAEASDGTQAVELAQRHSPDVVVLDVYMPVMDGFEAARKIVAACPCTLVLRPPELKRKKNQFDIDGGPEEP